MEESVVNGFLQEKVGIRVLLVGVGSPVVWMHKLKKIEVYPTLRNGLKVECATKKKEWRSIIQERFYFDMDY